MNEVIREHLGLLYGEILGNETFEKLRARLNASPPAPLLKTKSGFQEKGVRAILITYGDQLREANQPPLRTLAEFADEHLPGAIDGIHILPFYPYSSDDGFSVIDYTAVNPALGAWADVARVGQNFHLMFDGVINHISAQSAWFQAFLRDDPRYRDYFIVIAGAPEGEPDLSQVVRPRTLPLLTEFTTPSGPKKVWTTFSADQIDLNYANPVVLLDIVDVLLFYVAHGAELIRLDAIAYLWKEIGTSCIHLPQTHRVIQLLRAILDEVAPHVALITETNVPHKDNISYFGDGYNEAQLVYNFALPPLTLHTFRTGDATALTQWAASLERPDRWATDNTAVRESAGPPVRSAPAFFNFLASHDGIGLNPARGLIADAEIAALVDRVVAHGGRVSYKNNSDGSTSPYELNINYFDALSDPRGGEPLSLQIDRFVAAHAIMFSLAGVPGIYFHSLFGSRGWPEGVTLLGHNRAINRQKLDRAEVERELSAPASLRAQVFQRLKHLLQIRCAAFVFDPRSEQRVINLNQAVFAVERGRAAEAVLCLHNVAAQPQTVTLDQTWPAARDLISGRTIAHEVILQPYEVLWLRHTT
jgi:sucrose phosphorylase